MIVPLREIRNIKVTGEEIKVTYKDNTTYTLNGNIEFDMDYKTNIDGPITDHCI